MPRALQRWALVVPASIGLGLLLDWVHLPAGWIIAGILPAAACALLTGEELRLNDVVFRFGRSTIGVLAGIPLTTVGVATLARFIVPGLAVTAITVAITLVAGFLLYRHHRELGVETSILSMLPGGAGAMPVMAKELGADYRYVSLSQYLRVLAVSFSLPLIAGAMLGHVETHPVTHAPPTVVGVLALLIVVAVAEPLGKLIHLPAPSILGSLLLGVVVELALPDPWTLYPPLLFRIAAFLMVGWMAGGSMSATALKQFAHELPATLAVIAILMGACAATAWPLAAVLDVSYFEGYLATTPGALDTVLALSDVGGAGPEVVTIQVIRLLVIFFIGGYLRQIIAFLGRRTDRDGN
ncbi:MAG: AbrB family transcriptional regulator [Corynebacterium sp.]|nr:AbrB family transcriptional regulator [Corynebacterium sp.]